MKVRLISIMILAAVLLAACSSPVTPVVSTPRPGDEQQAAPQASQAALQALANQLGVSLDAIKLDKIEDTQWPDACLGLPQPGEACAEVITPGYLITLSANGRSYEVHTNQDGQLVRLATGLLTDEQPLAVARVRDALANQLGINVDLVTVTGTEAVEWSDGCLGLGKPQESCLMAIVPGYRITLEANGKSYLFRTDQAGGQIREEPAQVQVDEKGITLSWSRSGGIAGFCDKLTVFVKGQAWASSCKTNDSGKSAQLTAEQRTALADWTQRFSSFNYEQKDDAVSDAMTIQLVFTGSGQQTPSDADKAAILAFAETIYTTATK